MASTGPTSATSIESGDDGDGKYTEAEMQEFAQAARAEGVEAGIRIGHGARAATAAAMVSSRCRSLWKWRDTATTGSLD